MRRMRHQSGLIGYSGFVGSTLQRQRDFSAVFRSSNIEQIQGLEFDLLFCAAAPAQKWLANRDPKSDRRNIENLLRHLEKVTCRTFVLISTVDVFQRPIGVDEDSLVNEEELHAYGRHRRMLEKFVEQRFSKSLIVRLPGLVGPGLRKNVIFDFLNDNNLDAIDGRGVFQFYPMVNLWHDIQLALNADLKLVHLTAEPVSVADVASEAFDKPFDHVLPGTPATYDMRTRYAALFGGSGSYQYSQRESLQAVRAYAQSEVKAAKVAQGGAP